MTAHGHPEHDRDAGAYLLGALGESEAQAFERHLLGCEECANELERLTVAVDALPRSVSQLEPPESLKIALMETVRSEGPAEATARRPERPRARRRMPRLFPALAWVAPALLLAVGLATGYGLATLGSDGADAPPRTLTAEVDRARLPSGSARLVVPPGDGAEPVLDVEGFEQPAGGGVYQVWLLRGRRPVPAGLLAVRADGTGKAVVDGDVEGVKAVLLTRERRGGASAPTEIPLLRIPLA